MNRRQAMELLTVLPEATRVSIARPAPDDVIVIECDHVISPDGAARLRAQVSGLWPGRRCAVFGKGVRIKFAQESDDPNGF